MTRARVRALGLVAFAAILAMAAWARLAIYPHVFARGEVIPQIDGDSFFHVKRILATLREFPRIPRFDPWMNWPDGAVIPWADGFDLGGAFFALLVGGRVRGDVAPVAVALWPVVIGVLTVAATYRLVRICLPSRAWIPAALAAAAGAALVPGSISIGLLGRVDHHGAEALVLILLVSWAMRAFPAAASGALPRSWRFEAGGALLSALGVWVFIGSPVYVAIVSPPLVLAAVRSGRLLGSGGIGLLGGAALSLLLSLPFVRVTGEPWTFRIPSLLQPLAVAACGAGVLAGAWVLTGAGRVRVRRAMLVVAAGAGGIVALGIATSALTQVGEAITGWLLHRDPWIDGIQEFAPHAPPVASGGLALDRLAPRIRLGRLSLPGCRARRGCSGRKAAAGGHAALRHLGGHPPRTRQQPVLPGRHPPHRFVQRDRGSGRVSAAVAAEEAGTGAALGPGGGRARQHHRFSYPRAPRAPAPQGATRGGCRDPAAGPAATSLPGARRALELVLRAPGRGHGRATGGGERVRICTSTRPDSGRPWRSSRAPGRSSTATWPRISSESCSPVWPPSEWR